MPLAPPVTSAFLPSSLIGAGSIDWRARSCAPWPTDPDHRRHRRPRRRPGAALGPGGRADRDRLALGRAGRGGGRAGPRGGPRRRGRGAARTRTAAKRGPIVFLTVPFRAQSENLNNLREALQPGQILVDCTVPLAAAVSGKATRSLGVWQGSAAQQAQEMVPEGVTVVAALHTVGAPTLADAEAELDEDVLVCGDRKADKARVARLIELIPGLRAVNAGALEMARIVEQLTPMLISVNSPLQGPRRDPADRACPTATTGLGRAGVSGISAASSSPAAPAAPSSPPGCRRRSAPTSR